jgi:ABC-type nitrate/sulfonate/bicarbonate transport system substrate-binding protein
MRRSVLATLAAAALLGLLASGGAAAQTTSLRVGYSNVVGDELPAWAAVDLEQLMDATFVQSACERGLAS